MRTCGYRANSHNIAAPGRCGCGLPGRVENLPGARQCLRRRRAWTRGPRERAHLVSVAEQVPPVAATSCMTASSVHAQAGAVGRAGDDGGRKNCFIGVRRKVESESSSNRSTSPYTLTSPRTAPLSRHSAEVVIDQVTSKAALILIIRLDLESKPSRAQVGGAGGGHGRVVIDFGSSPSRWAFFHDRQNRLRIVARRIVRAL